MKIISKVLGFICALIVAIPLWAQHFPALTGYVVDEAGILTDQERYEMTQRLQALQPQQIVVATVTSLDGYDIDQYANLLFRHWALGDKDRDDGVLILLAPNERFVRIEVGYGLEDVLTDALSGQIVHNKMIPLARQNKFAEALQAGVNAIADILSGKTPSSSYPVLPFKRIFSDNSILLFCMGMFALSIFVNIWGHKIKAVKKNCFLNYLFFIIVISGIIFFYFPFFLFFPLILWPFIGLHFFVLVGSIALLPIIKNPKYPFNELIKINTSHGHHGGHGFSGGGFGGGGGGGFGGGGGSSGGGGASGGF